MQSNIIYRELVKEKSGHSYLPILDILIYRKSYILIYRKRYILIYRLQTPDSTNPRNKGIAEHEQNGVTIPKKPANTLPVKRDLPSKILQVFSGEKYERIIPTMKIINASNISTFGTSKMKKRNASVNDFPLVNPKTWSTRKSENDCK